MIDVGLCPSEEPIHTSPVPVVRCMHLDWECGPKRECRGVDEARLCSTNAAHCMPCVLLRRVKLVSSRRRCSGVESRRSAYANEVGKNQTASALSAID